MEFFGNIFQIVVMVFMILLFIITVIIASTIKSENLSMRIKILNLEEKIDNLISGSKRVERITDAINQRTRSYIANCGEKKKQTPKKNNISSKSKRQPNKNKKA